MSVKQGNNQVKNTCKKLTVKLKMVKKDNFTSATVFKSTFEHFCSNYLHQNTARIG